jgi:hypothetical protein
MIYSTGKYSLAPKPLDLTQQVLHLLSPIFAIS